MSYSVVVRCDQCAATVTVGDGTIPPGWRRVFGDEPPLLDFCSRACLVRHYVEERASR